MDKVFVASQLPQSALFELDKLTSSIDYWEKEETITEQELILKLKEKTILICGIDVQVTKKILEASPSLKLITNVGDGYSNIDLKAANQHQVLVTNAPTNDSIASTAEQTVTLLLSVSRKILQGDTVMREHRFSGWRVTGYVGGHQVYGKKVVIIGLGRVGKKVVELLSGFDVDLYYVDPKPIDPLFLKQYQLKNVTLEEGLKLADYVTLNCTLTQENHHMIQSEELDMMKETSYLINCARGPLINEQDLTEALKDKKIAGAALDVYEFEPKISKELASLSSVVLTPHAGNATIEAREEMAMDAVRNVGSYLKGQPLSYLVESKE